MPHPISTGSTYSRKPSHQNTFAFKHNAKSKLTDKILSSPIVNVCVPCSEKLAWRKQYRKYKPLTQPSVCNDCKMKRIVAAYHTICTPCATSRKNRTGGDGRDVCEICLNKNDEFRMEGVIKDTTSPDGLSANQARKRAEEAEELRGLRERERRAVLRKNEKEERINAKKDRRARRAQEGGADVESADEFEDEEDDDDDEEDFVLAGGAARGDDDDDAEQAGDYCSDDDDAEEEEVVEEGAEPGVEARKAPKGGDDDDKALLLLPPLPPTQAKGGSAEGTETVGKDEPTEGSNGPLAAVLPPPAAEKADASTEA